MLSNYWPSLSSALPLPSLLVALRKKSQKYLGNSHLSSFALSCLMILLKGGGVCVCACVCVWVYVFEREIMCERECVCVRACGSVCKDKLEDKMAKVKSPVLMVQSCFRP